MQLHSLRHLIAAAVLGLAAGSAAAYSGLVVFGDSLSDNGNAALAVGPDPGQIIDGNGYVPSRPYASGTFSDGLVWADMLATAMGVASVPSLAGGDNFAVGGAQTRDGDSPSLRSQVNSFLNVNEGFADPTALYVVAGGGNNARAALEDIGFNGAPLLRTVLATSLKYAQDVGIMVDQLQAAGATDIIVWNTPNLGLAPAVIELGPDASFLGQVVSSAMNRALANRLSEEGPGVQIFDLYGLLGRVVADPAAYGLVNAADACGAVAGCDPATYLFWDGIHPTSGGGHAIIAQEMMALAAVPEPGAWALFAAGGLLIAARLRHRAG
jgi:outer membrane lipase/esterase